jgi:hypothetical protein
MIGRDRGLSPGWVQRESFARCSIPARLLLFQLLTVADDLGRTWGSIAILAGQLYPFDDRRVRDVLPSWIAELIGAGELRAYKVRGEAFLQITGWADLVRVDRVRGKQHPAPEAPIVLPHRDDFQAVQLPLNFAGSPHEPAPGNVADLRPEKTL